MEGLADVPRFQVLEQIPGTIQRINKRLEKARDLPPPPNSRKHRELIVPAGQEAREMLEQLGSCTPLWLALQRQALVRGWSFGDLEQLDKLDVVATAELLKALNIRPPRDSEADIEDYLEKLVTDGRNLVGDVRESWRLQEAAGSTCRFPAAMSLPLGWSTRWWSITPTRRSTNSGSCSQSSWPAGVGGSSILRAWSGC